MASSDHEISFLAGGSSCPATGCRQSPRFANWNLESPDSARRNPDVQRGEIKKAGLVVGQISYRISEQFLPSTVINQSLEVGMIVRHGEPLDLLVTVVSNQEP